MGDADQLRDVEAALATLHLDHPSALADVLPSVRAYLGTETIVLFSPLERPDGSLAVERFHTDGFADAHLLQRRFEQFFRGASRRYAWYDVVSPEPDQRNRVIDALDLMTTDELEQSTIYDQVLRPLDLHAKRQPRMLLCDGPSLLAWFGAFVGERASADQCARMRRIAPAVRRRLSVERRLANAPHAYAALEACLEQLGAPAFVLGPTGIVHEANTAGRALLDSRGQEVRQALHACVHHRPTPLAFELARLEHHGAAAGWLAILPPRTDEERLRAAVERAAARWQLTARQRDVLALVVGGTPNTSIAIALRISVRAVELHVTKLLDHAGVDSRAALVARVLLG